MISCHVVAAMHRQGIACMQMYAAAMNLAMTAVRMILQTMISYMV